jgi:hypothetical protein
LATVKACIGDKLIVVYLNGLWWFPGKKIDNSCFGGSEPELLFLN